MTLQNEHSQRYQFTSGHTCNLSPYLQFDWLMNQNIFQIAIFDMILIVLLVISTRLPLHSSWVILNFTSTQTYLF